MKNIREDKVLSHVSSLSHVSLIYKPIGFLSLDLYLFCRCVAEKNFSALRSLNPIKRSESACIKGRSATYPFVVIVAIFFKERSMLESMV